jgi:gliding motility-associated-like protein
MKNLEEQLKETFDHFEPEVDPSVWAKVSSAITPPVGPTVVASGKVASSVLSSVGGWIAAAAVVVAGSLILYFTQKENKQPVSQNQQTEQVGSTNNKVETSLETPTNQAQMSTEKFNSANNFDKGTADKNTISASEKVINSDVETATNKEINSQSEQGVLSTHENKSENNVAIKNATANNTISQTTSDAKSDVSNLPKKETQIVPDFKLIVSSTTGFAPFKVTALTNIENAKVDFDFGDGALEVKANSATHVYENAGSYTLTCSYNGKESKVTINVIGQIATAFSPNGDGVNDQFTINGDNVQNVEIKIYSRSGKPVYNGKGSSISWDGNLADGTKADAGTYFYDIFATSFEGVSFKQKGTINIFR